MGKISEYVESVRDKPFEWKEHDCLSFIETYTGKDLGFSYEDKETAIKEFVTHGEDGLIEACDDNFERSEYPFDGCILLSWVDPKWPTFGVICYGKSVFVTEEGLTFEPVGQYKEMYWKVN